MAITYRGERFSGYNKPKRSKKGGKKSVVLERENGKVKMIRFGDANMKIKKIFHQGVKVFVQGMGAIRGV